MLTVRDLVARLLEQDQDAYAALASDPEGNDYHLVEDVGLDSAANLELSVPGYSAVDTEVVVVWP